MVTNPEFFKSTSAKAPLLRQWGGLTRLPLVIALASSSVVMILTETVKLKMVSTHIHNEKPSEFLMV